MISDLESATEIEKNRTKYKSRSKDDEMDSEIYECRLNKIIYIQHHILLVRCDVVFILLYSLGAFIRASIVYSNDIITEGTAIVRKLYYNNTNTRNKGK